MSSMYRADLSILLSSTSHPWQNMLEEAGEENRAEGSRPAAENQRVAGAA